MKHEIPENTGYSIIETAGLTEVITAFMECEEIAGNHGRGTGNSTEKELLIKIGELYGAGNKNNPLIMWILDRNDMVERWVKARVSLDELFSSGVNPDIDEHLFRDDVRCNIKKLVETARLLEFAEFQTDANLSEPVNPIFCISRSIPGMDGSIELIDGFHRVVSLLARGIENAESFIGVLKAG